MQVSELKFGIDLTSLRQQRLTWRGRYRWKVSVIEGLKLVGQEAGSRQQSTPCWKILKLPLDQVAGNRIVGDNKTFPVLFALLETEEQKEILPDKYSVHIQVPSPDIWSTDNTNESLKIIPIYQNQDGRISSFCHITLVTAIISNNRTSERLVPPVKSHLPCDGRNSSLLQAKLMKAWWDGERHWQPIYSKEGITSQWPVRTAFGSLSARTWRWSAETFCCLLGGSWVG